jgi:hypothetical protein
MNTNVFTVIVAFMASFLIGVVSVHSGQPVKSDIEGSNGYLELECNISQVDLHVCPQDKFERKTVRVFFGLFKSHKESCSESEVFLGTTPFRPVTLPAGKYVMLVPSDYTWEHNGPIKFNIEPDKKTFFTLKLFKRHSSQIEGGPSDPGESGASGGAGTPGLPGSSGPKK